jgi:hypothetical protein
LGSTDFFQPLGEHQQEQELDKVETGNNADLLILQSNPVGEIHLTQKIDAVIPDGNCLSQADIQGMLNARRKR